MIEEMIDEYHYEMALDNADIMVEPYDN